MIAASSGVVYGEKLFSQPLQSIHSNGMVDAAVTEWPQFSTDQSAKTFKQSKKLRFKVSFSFKSLDTIR